MPKLPLKPMKIISAVRDVREQSRERARVLVTGTDRDAAKAVYETLTAGGRPEQSACLIDSSIGGNGGGLPPLTHLSGEDVIVLVMPPSMIESEEVGNRLTEVELAKAKAVVVLTEAPGIEVSFPGVGPSRVVGMAPGQLLPADVLAEAVADAAGDGAVALAAQLPVLRQQAVQQIIRRTSIQNAVVGCLFFIPGADMPVMTLNQARMVLRIAAAHGEPLGTERALELLSVIGSGFVFRGAARQLLDFLPGPGWVIKGSVAWSGTRALGEAARAYFDGSVRVTPSRLEPLVDKLKKLRG